MIGITKNTLENTPIRTSEITVYLKIPIVIEVIEEVKKQFIVTLLSIRGNEDIEVCFNSKKDHQNLHRPNIGGDRDNQI